MDEPGWILPRVSGAVEELDEVRVRSDSIVRRSDIQEVIEYSSWWRGPVIEEDDPDKWLEII